MRIKFTLITVMNTVFRAPIQQEQISMLPKEEDKRPRTRSGYLVPEAYACYEKALGEVGTAASGKAIHFAADLICSGGLDIWIRGAYSYAVQQVNLANPRIFVYLREKITALDAKSEKLPDEKEDNLHTDADTERATQKQEWRLRELRRDEIPVGKDHRRERAAGNRRENQEL